MTTNKNVLFIAFNFPPMGGPGVQRSLQFIKYLREFGYEPIVLTINESEIKKLDAQMDRTLVDYIPNDIKITRISTGVHHNFINLMTKLKIFRLFWYFFYPKFWERTANWHKIAYKPAIGLISKYNIDLVYTSSGPFSPIILGRRLQKNAGIKWVADLRDPFTDAYASSFPSKIHWYFARRFEKKILSFPDKLIVNTPAVKELYLKRKITSENKIEVITNGF